MRSAFRLVARLGPGPHGYPWILADARNWVLRLGPGHGDDDRFYSNLPSLLEGMTAHWLRRHLGPADGLQLLLQEHRAALAEARELGRRLGNRPARRPGRLTAFIGFETPVKETRPWTTPSGPSARPAPGCR